jgi:Fe-S cluster assembly scaffold protein SufB
MKNVKNVNYWQVDHKIKKIFEAKGVEILTSKSAWEKYNWARKYFFKKPKEGYFIWIKKQIDHPLFTCVSVVAKNTEQELENLLILEKNLNINLQGTCNAQKRNLSCKHKAQGKIILKENSTLKYEHVHSWGQKDIVEPNYEFLLEKNSKLDYTFKAFFTPKKLKINTSLNLFGGASCNLKILANCTQTEAEIKDTLRLIQKGAKGQIKLRLVGRKNSKISARSQIVAEAEGKGHLDCQGLLIDKNSAISLIPELICRDKDAQITHEALIGKVSEEELNYLRQRGLNEEEAVNLIVTGFLKLEEQGIYSG